MTREVTALLVFCEGKHEVAFMHRLLTKCLGFSDVQYSFSEYPSPFKQMFKENVERHMRSDHSLDSVHSFYLPVEVLESSDLIVLLFDARGIPNMPSVGRFLDGFLEILENAETFRSDSWVKNARYLFLYDADARGAERLRAKIKKTFATVGQRPFLTADWSIDASDSGAATAAEIGVYIWSGEQGLGTIEDVLMPVVRACDPSRVDKAERCVDDLFVWEVDSPKLKRCVSQRASRQKAIMTLLGQKNKPGSSLNVIIDQTDLLEQTTLLADTRVSSFARFLAGFIGIELPK